MNKTYDMTFHVLCNKGLYITSLERMVSVVPILALVQGWGGGGEG